MTHPHIRVHLADGDYFLRLGLESLLASCPEVSLEKVTSTGNEAIESALSMKPNIVLMESSISNVCSMEATRRIAAGSSETKVVMFSATYDLETISRAHAAGACSFLAKNSVATDLGAALRMINSGNMIFSQPLDAPRFPARSSNDFDLQARFLKQTSPRDRRILNALANGYTNIQIAALLHISEGTVKAQLAKIMEPMRATNRVQLAVLAVRAGILEAVRPTLPLSAGPPTRHSKPRS